MTRRHVTLTLTLAALLLAATLPGWAAGDQRKASLERLEELLRSDDATSEELSAALAAIGELGFQPPACVAGSEMFDDVPASSPFCPWIEELGRRGITAGCDENSFCPGEAADRAQTAVFIVRTLGEADWHNVGEPGEPVFGDPAAPGCEWGNFLSPTLEVVNPVGFRLDGDGVVHLRGIAKLTDIGDGKCEANFNETGAGPFPPENTIFLLPEGYRPARDAAFAVLTNHQLGRISVQVANEEIGIPAAVIVNIPATFANVSAWISLDGISFPLDD